MTAAQLFWVAKNGIRFTGMPAWGPSRSDQDVWDAVSLLMTLPKMSPADYEALDRRIASMPPVQRQVAEAASNPSRRRPHALRDAFVRGVSMANN